VEESITRFGVNLLIIPCNPKWSGFGLFAKNMGIGIVEFIALGPTKSFVVNIER